MLPFAPTMPELKFWRTIKCCVNYSNRYILYTTNILILRNSAIFRKLILLIQRNFERWYRECYNLQISIWWYKGCIGCYNFQNMFWSLRTYALASLIFWCFFFFTKIHNPSNWDHLKEMTIFYEALDTYCYVMMILQNKKKRHFSSKDAMSNKGSVSELFSISKIRTINRNIYYNIYM
ncbi:hypothetical protein BpHYR1_043254 [Brachionus plicatilis]|uniref:Uncharacterized protein n=1 Tax=Brachionus plicatilis TaxID=10195 RepID=A0A3M7P9H8_BRAPC|nr:hypothetical protein BpHYR1_043254 [Brachionus plicatilis]